MINALPAIGVSVGLYLGEKLWTNLLPTRAHKQKIIDSAKEIAEEYTAAIQEIDNNIASVEGISKFQKNQILINIKAHLF